MTQNKAVKNSLMNLITKYDNMVKVEAVTDMVIILHDYRKNASVNWILQLVPCTTYGKWMQCDSFLLKIYRTYDKPIMVKNKQMPGYYDYTHLDSDDDYNREVVMLLEEWFKESLHDNWHDWANKSLESMIKNKAKLT